MKKSLVTALISLAALSANAQSPARTITMQGIARITASPSQAVVSAGANTNGKNAKDAFEANHVIMNRVLAGLKEIGIDPKDVVSQNISLRPVIEYNNKNIPRVLGYEASHQLTITFKDIGKLGEGLDKIVVAGANNIGEVQLTAPISETKQEEARISAVKDAVKKARVLVEAAGSKLGKVITVSLNPHQSQPRTMARASMSKMSADMPVATGEQTDEISVSVTFEIVD